MIRLTLLLVITLLAGCGGTGWDAPSVQQGCTGNVYPAGNATWTTCLPTRWVAEIRHDGRWAPEWFECGADSSLRTAESPWNGPVEAFLDQVRDAYSPSRTVGWNYTEESVLIDDQEAIRLAYNFSIEDADFAGQVIVVATVVGSHAYEWEFIASRNVRDKQCVRDVNEILASVRFP